MERYECDNDMRTLEGMIRDFTRSHGYDLPRVLDDLLDYILAFFDIEGKGVEGWRYSEDDNAAFCGMMQEYFKTLGEVLKKQTWYDAWGDLFMALHPKGGDRGQFFTPKDICSLMTDVTLAEPKETHLTPLGVRYTFNDPTAGSARNLLAAHAAFIEKGWRKPYLSAEDLDYTCCKMSAINMVVHGCFGEVVCHNTLTEPDSVRCGFIINEGLLREPAMPTIRRVNDNKIFLCTRQWAIRKEQYENRTI